MATWFYFLSLRHAPGSGYKPEPAEGEVDMNLKLVLFIVLIFSFLCPNFSCAGENKLLIQPSGGKYGGKCREGLHFHAKGDFSVFIYCCGALGVNIGIVKTINGGTPSMDTSFSSCITPTQSKTKEFWQSAPWGTDIMSLAWNPSGSHLFVATHGIYGDGGLFKLDLKRKTFDRIFPDDSADYMKKDDRQGYYTRIESMNLEENNITVEVYGYYEKGEDKFLKRQLISMD